MLTILLQKVFCSTVFCSLASYISVYLISHQSFCNINIFTILKQKLLENMPLYKRCLSLLKMHINKKHFPKPFQVNKKIISLAHDLGKSVDRIAFAKNKGTLLLYSQKRKIYTDCVLCKEIDKGLNKISQDYFRIPIMIIGLALAIK